MKNVKEIEKRLKKVRTDYYQILDEINRLDDEVRVKFIDYELLNFKELNHLANFKLISKNISNLQDLNYSLFKGLIKEFERLNLDDLVFQAQSQNANIYRLYNQTIKEFQRLINLYFIEAYETKLNEN